MLFGLSNQNKLNGGFGKLWKEKNAYKALVKRLERKSSLGRPRPRLDDKIKIHIKGIKWLGVYCIDVAQQRVIKWV